MWQYRIALVLLTIFASPSWQYVSIELKNGSRSLGDKYKYEDDSVFTYRYANFPDNGKMSGYVWRWESFPVDGCEYIPPLPYAVQVGGSRWFALIEEFGVCEEEMVKNLRNAGFDLILGYTNGSSSAPDLSKSLRNSGFPIVAIRHDYVVGTLWEIAAVNRTEGAVKVDISTTALDELVVGFSAGMLVLLVTLFFVVFVLLWRRSRRRGRYRLPQTTRDPVQQQRYAHARLARQELIESILRQLQELQVEHRQHPPLGEAATRALPQKTFAQARRESSVKETCAICVEEFQEDDVTRVLPCNHFFHPTCIDPWLTDHSSMCPLCKQSVSQQNEAAPPPPRAPRSISPISMTTTSITTSADFESVEDFGTPAAGSPAAVAIAGSPTLARQVRASSVNDDSSSRSSSDAPLLSRPPAKH